MTGSPLPPRTAKYWPVLLLDASAVTVLFILALTQSDNSWWWVLTALWAAVGIERARNEHHSRHVPKRPC
jgi:hypothetical protein